MPDVDAAVIRPPTRPPGCCAGPPVGYVTLRIRDFTYRGGALRLRARIPPLKEVTADPLGRGPGRGPRSRLPQAHPPLKKRGDTPTVTDRPAPIRAPTRGEGDAP